MLDTFPPELLNLTGPAALSLIAVLVITRRLVWHTDLREVKTDRDYWKGIALRALGVAEKMTIHAEVASEVLTSAATPAAEVADP